MDTLLTVRRFVPEDAGKLTELLHDAYAHLGAMGLNYTAVDQDESVTLARATHGACWVVDSGSSLVGTLTISLPPSQELQALTAEARAPRRAWLNQVAVAPANQGTGIARHLWNLGRAWAIEAGAGSIGVDTAVPATHLMRLYEAWGFARSGVIHWPGKKYDSAVLVRSLTDGDVP